VIDQSGGSLAGPLGAAIVVPPLSLSAPVTITISQGDPITRNGSGAIGDALKFEPAGTAFATPTTITLPFTPGSIPAGRSAAEIVVAKRDDTSGSVAVMSPASVSGNRLAVLAFSFSTFQAHIPAGPAPPSALVATPTAFNRVALSWTDGSLDEIAFRIERSGASGDSFAPVGQVSANVTAFADTSVTGATTYSYRVVAVNPTGDSAPSGSVQVVTPTIPGAPAAPTGLTASSPLPTRVDLSWIDASNNETEFLIERRISGGAFVDVGSVAAGVQLFTDFSVIGGFTFDYRVRASNRGVYSSPSNAATVSTPAAPPAAPTNVVATAVSDARVDVTWSDNAINETGFQIERRQAGVGTFSVVATQPANSRSAQDATVAALTTYEYRVRAVRGAILSEFSNLAVAGTPAIGAPPGPTNLSVVASSRSVMNLSWTDNASNETGFRIERREAGLGAFSSLQLMAANSTAFTDTTAVTGTAYDYRVFATNAIGDSPPSNVALVYSIIYVRYPRRGDTAIVTIPDGENPYAIEPGADLMLLYPDGTEDVLVDCRTFAEPAGAGQVGNSVQDPVVSLDGRTVYYSKYVGLQNGKPWEINPANCFLFKMRLDVQEADRREIQLTTLGRGFATDKLTGNASEDLITNFGIRDLGAAIGSDGRIVFTTNREAVIAFVQGVPPSVGAITASTCSQLATMSDHDGTHPNKNLRILSYGSLHQDQHPIVLKDGRILFTHWDDAGLRTTYGATTLFTIEQDGSNLNQFLEPHNAHKKVDHFATQLSSGPVIVTNYYPFMFLWGFGHLIRHHVDGVAPFFQRSFNTAEDDFRYFSRIGTQRLTTHTDGEHFESPNHSGRYSTPAALPQNALLFSYSSGPVVQGSPASNDTETPRLDAGIYAYDGDASTTRITSPSQLRLIKNSPDHNELWPRPLLSYARTHGVLQPGAGHVDNGLRPTPRDRGLVLAIPMGLVGTSSMQNREATHLGPNDVFTNPANFREGGPPWSVQGAEAGPSRPEDLFGVRVLLVTPDRFHKPFNTTSAERANGFLPDSRHTTTVKGYASHTDEPWKILGEFSTRNTGGTSDPDGKSDTSFLARVPANTPFLLQAIDARGMTLYTEQTWRHVNSGETLADCGGCHAHSVPGIPFQGKKADTAAYQPVDLVRSSPQVIVDAIGNTSVQSRTTTAAWGVEFRRDVLPILTAKCGDCHFGSPPPNGAMLSLFPTQPNPGEVPATFETSARVYNALANDPTGQFSSGQPIPGGGSSYVSPQTSRYVRALQARQSYLSWKLWGSRLDGRANSDFPLPSKPQTADLDFQQANCLAAARTTPTEKGLITRWIDLGCPIDFDRPKMKYTDDSMLPVLSLRVTATGGFVQVRVGAVDVESGIDEATLRVDLSVTGGPSATVGAGGASITLDQTTAVGVVTTSIPTAAISPTSPLNVTATVQDRAGNRERVEFTLDGPPTGAP